MGPLVGIMAQVVGQLEDIEEEQGEPLVFGPPDPDDWADLMAEEEQERLETSRRSSTTSPGGGRAVLRGAGARSSKEGIRRAPRPSRQRNVGA